MDADRDASNSPAVGTVWTTPFHRLESKAFPAAHLVSHESTRLVRRLDALSFTDHVFFVEFVVRVRLGTG